MSDLANERFLQNARERFDETYSGLERTAILSELSSLGLNKSVEILKEDWYQERVGWLDERGVHESDIMIEDDESIAHFGLEYYMHILEDGNPGDDYQVDLVKRYIPIWLDVEKWLA